MDKFLERRIKKGSGRLMNILLVNAPSRKNSIVPPLGLLQVEAILEKEGHNPIIYDPILDDPIVESEGFNRINKLIDEFSPEIIGYGGIATSYGSVKRFSSIVKKKSSSIIQIAGGPLSSVYDLLLRNAGIDIVVHGEAEVSLPILISRLKHGHSIENIPGISFLNRTGDIIKNNPAEQIKNLDELPLPSYHLVDLPRYFRHIKKSMNLTKVNIGSENSVKEIIEKIGDDDRWIEIITGRGCTHRCLFCYRHMKGIRYYSADYVLKHIKFLNKRYGIRGFQFADELFNGDKDRVYEICDAIEKSGINIFFTIGGARVDKIDKDMIKRLKDVGCIEINYGQESGSNKILKDYRKGVTADQNRKITMLTKNMGINCPVQIVIGSPNETNETIKETIDFLKDMNGFEYSLNYLIPLPETPIWAYVKEKGLINDVEAYLDKVAEYGGQPLINLTAMPDMTWKSWRVLIKKEMRLYYLKKSKRFGRYIIEYIMFLLVVRVYPYMPERLSNFLKKVVKKFIF